MLADDELLLTLVDGREAVADERLAVLALEVLRLALDEEPLELDEELLELDERLALDDELLELVEPLLTWALRSAEKQTVDAARRAARSLFVKFLIYITVV